MSQSGGNGEREVRRIIRMLDKTMDMATNPMWGETPTQGRAFAVQSYNSVVRHLAEMGEIATTLFPLLPEEAGISDVGIASGQLAEYLRAGLPEPEAPQSHGGAPHDINIVNIGGHVEITTVTLGISCGIFWTTIAPTQSTSLSIRSAHSS